MSSRIEATRRGTGTSATGCSGASGACGVVVRQAGGRREQVVAQLAGLRVGQVRQLDARPGAAGHVELEPGQPEDPGDQGLDDVHGLQAVEPGSALTAHDDPVPQLERLGGDAVAGQAPGQHEQ